LRFFAICSSAARAARRGTRVQVVGGQGVWAGSATVGVRLPARPPQVCQEFAGAHGRQDGQAAAADADLAVAQPAGDDDAPTSGRVWALGVLDPAAADAPQVPVVDDRVVGDQQLERGVVEVDVDLDVAGRDLWGAQVQHGVPAVGAHLELACGGPVAEPLGHRVVGGDPDR